MTKRCEFELLALDYLIKQMEERILEIYEEHLTRCERCQRVLDGFELGFEIAFEEDKKNGV